MEVGSSFGWLERSCKVIAQRNPHNWKIDLGAKNEEYFSDMKKPDHPGVWEGAKL